MSFEKRNFSPTTRTEREGSELAEQLNALQQCIKTEKSLSIMDAQVNAFFASIEGDEEAAAALKILLPEMLSLQRRIEQKSSSELSRNQKNVAIVLSEQQQGDDFAEVYNRQIALMITHHNHLPNAAKPSIENPESAREENSRSRAQREYEQAIQQAALVPGNSNEYKEVADAALGKLIEEWYTDSQTVARGLRFLQANLDTFVGYYQAVLEQFPLMELPPNTEAVDSANGKISEVTICINLGITSNEESLSWEGVRGVLVARGMYLAGDRDKKLHIVVSNEAQQRHLETVFETLVQKEGAAQRHVSYTVDPKTSTNRWVRDPYIRTSDPHLTVVSSNITEKNSRQERSYEFKAIPNSKLTEEGGDRSISAPLWFEGGDIAITPKNILIGDKIMGYNRNLLSHGGQPASTQEVIQAFEKFFRKKTLYIGREATPIQFPSTQFGSTAQIERNSQTIYHQDLYLTPLGESRDGKQQIAVADPELAMELLTQAYGSSPVEGLVGDLQKGPIQKLRELIHAYQPTVEPPPATMYGLLADPATTENPNHSFADAINKIMSGRESFKNDLLLTGIVKAYEKYFSLPPYQLAQQIQKITVRPALEGGRSEIQTPHIDIADFSPDQLRTILAECLQLSEQDISEPTVTNNQITFSIPENAEIDIQQLSSRELADWSYVAGNKNNYARVRLFLESITRQLDENGFEVVRLPYLPAWPKTHSAIFSWNNALVESYPKNGTIQRQIEVPSFGVPVLENAVEQILREQGFQVIQNEAAWPLLWGSEDAQSGVDGILHCATLEQRAQTTS